MIGALPELNGAVDLVIANPPYIPFDAFESVVPEVRDHDPPLALFSGQDGLDAIRVVVAEAARLLRPTGLLVRRARRRTRRSRPNRSSWTMVAFPAYVIIPISLAAPRFVTALRRTQ